MEVHFLNSGIMVTIHPRYHERLPQAVLGRCREIVADGGGLVSPDGPWHVTVRRAGAVAHCEILKSRQTLVEFVVVQTAQGTQGTDAWQQFVYRFQSHCHAGRADQCGPIPAPPTVAPWFALIMHRNLYPLPESEQDTLAVFQVCLAHALIEQASGFHPAFRN